MSEPKPLISVVVPVYNVEKYLERCVLSIMAQSYNHLQIILVDDGAKDSSGEICDRLSASDSRISVFHTQNGGLSAARNYGMTHVEGDYVLFVDSDDFIGRDHISNLWQAMESSPDVNLAVTSFTCFYDDQEEVEAKPTNAEERVLSPVEAFSIAIGSVTEALFQEYAWGKLYSKELFPLLKYPVGKLYEDRYVFYKVALQATAVAYENKNDYFYLRDRKGSITNNVDLRHLDCLRATEEILEYTRLNKPEAYPFVLKRYFSELLSYFGIVSQAKNAEISDELYRTILSYRKEVLSSEIAPLSTKLGYTSTFFGRHICELAILLNNSRAKAIEDVKRWLAIHKNNR